jgi:hypothetical protein
MIFAVLFLLDFVTARTSTSFQSHLTLPKKKRCDASSPLVVLHTTHHQNANTRIFGSVVDSETDSVSTSPFQSRFYPRTVPIPFRKRRTNGMRDANQNTFWLPGQRTYLRYRFLQQQQQQQQQQRQNVNSNHYVEWMEDIATTSSPYSNIRTLASLWDMVGNFTTQEHPTTQSRENQNGTTTTRIVALPNVDTYIIEQFVNILQWLLQQVEQQMKRNDRTATIYPVLHVSYNTTKIDFTTIPTIIMTLTQLLKRADEQTLPTLSSAHEPNSCTIPNKYTHEVITKRTRSWVQRILVDTSICPFTKSMAFSGQGLLDVNVPVGKIAYHTSVSNIPHAAIQNTMETSIVAAVCRLQSDVLVAIHNMLLAGPTYSVKKNLDGISSILLAAPGWDDHYDTWCTSIFPILEVSIQALDLTEEIGIVCFHPCYQTPDGRSFPGFGHMHSVPRLRQWMMDHKPYEEIQTAMEQSIPDLLTLNVIQNPIVMDNNDDDSKNILLSALATAGGAWQRRTPHATINVLRANQLAAAESKRVTPTLYTTNILRLSRIGWVQLQESFDHERMM